jgi:formyltetrahydrofolate deformylase
MSQLCLSRARQASLRLCGPDHKGIVAACSQLLDRHGCGITNSEQWTDRLANLYFQRVLFDTASLQNWNGQVRADSDEIFKLYSEAKMKIEFELKEMKTRFGLTTAQINWRERPRKVAVMVSKYDHCLVSPENPFGTTFKF